MVTDQELSSPAVAGAVPVGGAPLVDGPAGSTSAANRREPPARASGARDRSALGLAALLAGAGVLHMLVPRPYDAIVPRWVPGRARRWTYASGVAELACAAAVAAPRTRRAGAAAAAALFVGVFPANVQMAWDWRRRGAAARLVAIGRLPLQVPLVVWALGVRRRTTES